MKIAITGHRPNKLGNDYSLTSPLLLHIKAILQEQINIYQPEFMISGMALGIDTLWATLAIENNIKLIAAVPFKSQHIKWTIKSQEIYFDLLSKAHQMINISGADGYNLDYMQLRNEWMVDNCDMLIAVWDGTPGGTCNCFRYANKRNKNIFRINPSLI